MAGQVSSLIWLDRPEDRPMRPHAVLGDELYFPGAAWLTPDSIRLECARPDSALFLLRYRSCEEDRTMDFCLGRRPRALVAALMELRASNTPAAAERKWRPFISRLGAFPSLRDRSAQSAEQTIRYRGGAARIRRPVHPSALIDRLMMRDRQIAGEKLERLLAGGAAARPLALRAT